jgi:signal transduction histidine kinase
VRPLLYRLLQLTTAIFNVLFILTSMGGNANGQTPLNTEQAARDSLIQTFANIQDDSARVDSMIRVGMELGFGGEATLGVWIIEQAGEQAHTAKLDIWEVTSLLTIGAIYDQLGARDRALQKFLEGLELADSTGYVNGRAMAWNNVGGIQSQEYHFEDAVASLRKARQDFLSTNSKEKAAGVLLNVASVYSDMKELDRAILTFDSVLKELAPFKNPRTYGILHTNLGLVYLEQKQYAKARESLDLAVQYSQQAEDLYGVSEALIYRGGMRREMEDFGGALADVEAGIDVAKEMGAVELEARGYKALADLYKAQGSPGLALEWLERSIHITDSLATSDRNVALANMQAIYAVELKDAEIDNLNKDRAVQNANIESGRYFQGLLASGLVGMVGIVVFLFLRNRTRRKVNLALGEKNHQISAQKEEILSQNTELKTQNERLEDLNREMDGILHVVAHDLKAPLNQTEGLISLVLMEGNLTDAQRSYLEMILKVNGNAGRMVRDLVEISKLESEKDPMQFASLDLGELIREAYSFLEVEAQRKSITLGLDLPATPVVLATEKTFLLRILDNLVTNAIKFSKPGKKIRIGLEADAKGATISVEDEGPGLSAEDHAKLFKKFQRLSARPTAGETSTGLGLAIVHALVMRLRGDIHATSKPGEGTTFYVWIPR